MYVRHVYCHNCRVNYTHVTSYRCVRDTLPRDWSADVIADDDSMDVWSTARVTRIPALHPTPAQSWANVSGNKMACDVFDTHPANTRHPPNAGLMLDQRLIRWPNIKTVLGGCLVFATHKPTPLCEAKRQYQLTGKVSRYWLLASQYTCNDAFIYHDIAHVLHIFGKSEFAIFCSQF